MSQLDIASWKLESLRLTAFLSAPLADNGVGWWKKLTGQDPEAATTKLQTGEYIEDGEFEDYRLSFNANMLNPFRVDWMIYPQASNVSGFISIGGYVEASQRFFDHFVNSFVATDCPPVIRIAYGAILLREVQDKKQGYETLASHLPHIKFDTDNWSDFSFQINKLSDSSVVSGLKFNQISRWQLIRMHRIIIDQVSQMPKTDNYACRVELDLNTFAEYPGPFSENEVRALFKELREVANQYAEKGFPQ